MLQLREEADWKAKLELERARTMNLVQPKTNYKEKYEHLIGKDAALDAARSVTVYALSTCVLDTDPDNFAISGFAS